MKYLLFLLMLISSSAFSATFTYHKKIYVPYVCALNAADLIPAFTAEGATAGFGSNCTFSRIEMTGDYSYRAFASCTTLVGGVPVVTETSYPYNNRGSIQYHTCPDG